MVEHLGWRSVFWVNIPIGALAIVAGRTMLPRSRHLQPTGVTDRTGFVLLATAAVCALLALSGVSGTDLGTPLTVTLALAARTAAAITFDPRGAGARSTR